MNRRLVSSIVFTAVLAFGATALSQTAPRYSVSGATLTIEHQGGTDTVLLPCEASSVAASGDVAYAACGARGLVELGLKDPTSPVPRRIHKLGGASNLVFNGPHDSIYVEVEGRGTKKLEEFLAQSDVPESEALGATDTTGSDSPIEPDPPTGTTPDSTPADKFTHADTDTSGFVEYREYIKVAEAAGIAGEEAAQTFFRLDADQSGGLTRMEWQDPATAARGTTDTQTGAQTPSTTPSSDAPDTSGTPTRQQAATSSTKSETVASDTKTAPASKTAATETPASKSAATGTTKEPKASSTSTSGSLSAARRGIQPTGARTVREARRAGLPREGGFRNGVPGFVARLGRVSGDGPKVGGTNVVLYEALYLARVGVANLYPAVGGSAGLSTFVGTFDASRTDEFAGGGVQATMVTIGPEVTARGGAAYHVGRGVLAQFVLEGTFFYTFPVVADNTESEPLAALAVGPAVGFQFERIAKNTTLLRTGIQFAADGMRFFHLGIGVYFN